MYQGPALEQDKLPYSKCVSQKRKLTKQKIEFNCVLCSELTERVAKLWEISLTPYSASTHSYWGSTMCGSFGASLKNCILLVMEAHFSNRVLTN